MSANLIEAVRAMVAQWRNLSPRMGHHYESHAYAAAASELEAILGSCSSYAPTEKPLPDAPGWWIYMREASEIVGIRHVLRGYGGSLWLEDIEGDQEPVDSQPGFRWYGPIALPWGAK